MVEVASQRTFPATSSLLVPEIFASASLPWSHPALKAKVFWVGACVGSFLGSPTLLSASQRLVWASLGSPSLLSGQGHSLWASYDLRSAAFSVIFPLGPCFARFSEIPQLPLGPPMREIPSARELFLLHDSLYPLGDKLPS